MGWAVDGYDWDLNINITRAQLSGTNGRVLGQARLGHTKGPGYLAMIPRGKGSGLSRSIL